MNTHKGTLLIVDDTPANLKLLFTYLSTYDFTVRFARNGGDALKQVALAKPDLILLDVMMPEIDGFETCSRLKANEETRDIPVIFMSALTDTVDKVKGFEVGAVDYITKPIQQEEMLARITAHLTLINQQKLLKKQQTELEQNNLELQQQNEELEAFAHTVAHDLKNPLNAINGYMDLFMEDFASDLDAEGLKVLQKVEQSGWKMVNIIDSLLLLASSRRRQCGYGTAEYGRDSFSGTKPLELHD